MTYPIEHAARDRKTKRGPAILEIHVQQTVKQYLEIDGWRAFRTELTVQRERGRVVGERGQPDYLFIRYAPCSRMRDEMLINDTQRADEVLWVEFKRKGEKPRIDQLAWHKAERQRGALVLVVDDIDEFIRRYGQSGLCQMRDAARAMNALTNEMVAALHDRRIAK